MLTAKQWFSNFWYSFPVQLFLLHFKKHQLVLLYWAILFATVGGSFMKMFGANSLFLAPEYLDTVNGIGTAMVGAAVGVFIMSWNITTFILFSKHIKFLATAKRPFVTYCLNNFVIPLSFLLYYLYKAICYGLYNELFSVSKIIELSLGFLLGFTLNGVVLFAYFFKANSSIAKRIKPILGKAYIAYIDNNKQAHITTPSELLKVKTYLLNIRKTALVRQVQHYNKLYIQTVFNRHHLASVVLIILAFFFLIGISFFLDNKFFQIPAAASITVFFAILISLFGALAYFLQNWSLPFTIIIFLLINALYTHQIIDPTNKAFGLNYTTATRPQYNDTAIQQLCTTAKVAADKATMLAILNRWKQQQTNSKPIIYFINVSGGGNRSAAFTMNVLQRLDSLTNGTLMQQTFMINGASGGMLGAAYYRELYLQKKLQKLKNINTPNYADDISKDMLNPIFSSLVARDIISPAQQFMWQGQTYLKDRAYAFEQKLNSNTHNYLNKSVGDYAQFESNATIPLMLYNAIVLQDARKMIISTQPISYMMQPFVDSTYSKAVPDAIDFTALFAQQNPLNLRLLTALRMNATFPYILPTVWLPTNPIIDVMDAGIKDNYGQENCVRFIANFEDWLVKNTSKVVLITIRDRKVGNWDNPYITNNLITAISKPATQLQYNIFKMQDYQQNETFSLLQNKMGKQLQKVVFQYAPTNQQNHAALSFHLTNTEKQLIHEDVNNTINTASFQQLLKQ